MAGVAQGLPWNVPGEVQVDDGGNHGPFDFGVTGMVW